MAWVQGGEWETGLSSSNGAYDKWPESPTGRKCATRPEMQQINYKKYPDNLDPNNYNRSGRGKDLRPLAGRVLRALANLGLHVTNYSVTTNSIYLKFDNPALRSMTIRDHNTKAQYKYKWNLVIGYKGPHMVQDKKVPRYYYSQKQLKDFYTHIRNYAAKIESNAAVDNLKNIPKIRRRHKS